MDIGEPTLETLDVGVALRNREAVSAYFYTGLSVLSPGQKTDKVIEVERVLSPLAQHEVGTIRCIGLNVSADSSYTPR